MDPTHRTLVEQVDAVWCWALQRIDDSAVIAEGQASAEADASDAAIEAGHSLGLYTIDRTDSSTAMMAKA